MSACDECRDDFDAMSRLVEFLPDDMKTSNCVLNAEMLLVALAYQKAEKENAKLRELVADMWPHVRYRSRMCGKCDLPCDTSDECLLYEPMRQRMHDLGVEVYK